MGKISNLLDQQLWINKVIYVRDSFPAEQYTGTTGVSSLAFKPKSVDNKKSLVLYCINTSHLGVSEITTYFCVEWFTHFC